jgi:hypothetical protein
LTECATHGVVGDGLPAAGLYIDVFALAEDTIERTMEIDNIAIATRVLENEDLLLLKKVEAIRTFVTVFSVFTNSENL